MRDWFWAWKQEIKVTMRTQDLLNSFPSDSEIDNDTYRFTSIQAGRFFNVKYEWRVESDNGAFHITEDAYLSRSWYLVLAISLIGVCLGYIGVKTLGGLLVLGSFVATFLLLMVFVGLFIVLARLGTPVEGLFERGSNQTELMPMASLMLIVFPLFVVVLAVDGSPRIFGLFGIVASLTVYGIFHSWVVERSFPWQRWFVARMKRFPLIAANYITALGFSSIILIIFLATYSEPLFLAFVSRWPVAFPGLYGLVAVALVEMFRRVLVSAWRLEASEFQSQGRNIENPCLVVVTAVVVVAVSLGYGYLGYRFLDAAVQFLTVFPTVGAYGSIAVYGIPVWYFITGLIYQITRFSRGVVELFRRSERRSLDHILDVDAETYVIDYDGIYAGAVTLHTDYILVSQGILDKLCEEHVAVVLAHEEGHLTHRDTVLGLMLTLLSPLILTGKNVLYGVLDFRTREFQADQYAISRVNDRDQVSNTLDQLQNLKAEETTDDIPSITPTLLSLDSDEKENPSLLELLFGFYFGEFAMSHAHPDLGERKDRT